MHCAGFSHEFFQAMFHGNRTDPAAFPHGRAATRTPRRFVLRTHDQLPLQVAKDNNITVCSSSLEMRCNVLFLKPFCIPKSQIEGTLKKGWAFHPDLESFFPLQSQRYSRIEAG